MIIDGKIITDYRWQKLSIDGKRWLQMKNDKTNDINREKLDQKIMTNTIYQLSRYSQKGKCLKKY